MLLQSFKKKKTSLFLKKKERELNLKQLPCKQQKDGPKDLKSLPVRQYLDETVVPLLLKGMSALVRERYVLSSFVCVKEVTKS